jgi:hypothetical protein
MLRLAGMQSQEEGWSIHSKLNKYVFRSGCECITCDYSGLDQELPKPHTMESVKELKNKFKFHLKSPNGNQLKEMSTEGFDQEFYFSIKIINCKTISSFNKNKGKTLLRHFLNLHTDIVKALLDMEVYFNGSIMVDEGLK